jgi:hypothetical protein
VISAELPGKYKASDKLPHAEAKKWSDWEREKRAMNGEKLDQAAEIKSRRGPDLLETVLRSLAENGHHLRGLKEGQEVTLALTFRSGASQQCVSCHTVSSTPSNGVVVNANASLSSVTNPWQQPDAPANNVTSWIPQSSSNNNSIAANGQPSFAAYSTSLGVAANAGDGPANQVLLGDLHLKQGRFDEALATYRKAAEELSPRLRSYESVHAAGLDDNQIRLIMEMIDLQNRMIQCHLALKQGEKVTQGVQKLKKWTDMLGGLELTANQAKKQSKSAPPIKDGALPTKVIITASKQLLDQAGSGQIGFDEFAKKVVVEVLNFDQGPGKP